MRSLVGRVRPLALMLHLKIYDLQWKETQESSSLNILLLRPEIPEPERGSDLPNSSHSEPALSVAFLLFPCIARAQVNLLCSEEELQGPRCECKSSVDPPLQLLRKFNQTAILINNVPWAFRGRREDLPGRLKLERLFPGAEMWAGGRQEGTQLLLTSFRLAQVGCTGQEQHGAGEKEADSDQVQGPPAECC